ncbi:MAG: hypothetical protein ABI977_03810 [Acidobacteriota bacterium]
MDRQQAKHVERRKMGLRYDVWTLFIFRLHELEGIEKQGGQERQKQQKICLSCDFWLFLLPVVLLRNRTDFENVS